MRFVEAWVTGWAHSRLVAPPRRVPEGLYVDTGSAREACRWVLTRPSLHDLTSVTDQVDRPGTCVKFAGEPRRWIPHFPDGWEEDSAGWFMTAPWAPGRTSPVPAGYSVDRTVSDQLVVVTVRDGHGRPAASGRCGLADGFAVPDQIVTDDAHRRRGLGTVVMDRLRESAVEASCRRAILGATTDGRRLYERLGWEVLAPIVGAYFRPGQVDGSSVGQTPLRRAVQIPSSASSPGTPNAVR